MQAGYTKNTPPSHGYGNALHLETYAKKTHGSSSPPISTNCLTSRNHKAYRAPLSLRSDGGGGSPCLPFPSFHFSPKRETELGSGALVSCKKTNNLATCGDSWCGGSLREFTCTTAHANASQLSQTKRVAHRWHTRGMWVTVAPLWHKAFIGRAGGI